MAASGHPENVLIGIGATNYTPLGETTFLQPGDQAIVRVHAGHRLARNTDTRQTHPGLTNYTPVLMPPDRVTTRHQRPPKKRGLRTVLPIPTWRITCAFSTSLTTTVFSQRSMWRFAASLRKGGYEGPTFISCTAPCQEALPT